MSLAVLCFVLCRLPSLQFSQLVCHLVLSYCLSFKDSDDSSLVDACQSIIKDLFPSLVSQLQRAGWVTGHHLLGLKEWRYTVN